jgi:Reverse transcriptase (RNA-dependent DNA polymerase)
MNTVNGTSLISTDEVTWVFFASVRDAVGFADTDARTKVVPSFKVSLDAKEEENMAKHTSINDGGVLYEYEYLRELEKLIAKAGPNEIFVRYEFPAGILFASGFRPKVSQRRILIPLQLKSPSDLANSVFLFSLPEEEVSQYRRFEDHNGELCLSVAFPHCDRHPLNESGIAVLQVATKQELFRSLDRAGRGREAQGDMIIVRYADDVVLGFEHEADARRFLRAMKERLEKFSLALHPDKTRLIAFGRFATDQRARAGLGKPETSDFLGFTFISGKSRQGKFLVKRKSRRDRAKAKLREIRDTLRRKMHLPIPEQGSWLG